MLVKNIKGLKYPDEYVTRFFFKEALDKKSGKLLDLGSGNGNNSLLFYQFGWDVTGVDIDQAVVENALSNFTNVQREYNLSNKFNFICDDMVSFMKSHLDKDYDSLVIASSIYYMHQDKIEELLSYIKKNKTLRPDANIYLRFRTVDDYRYGKGVATGKNTFKLNINETGEEGCEITFFKDESDFLELFCKYLPMTNVRSMNLIFDNYQNDKLIKNTDIVVFGKYKF